VCDGWTPQNSAHIQRCQWVGDGKGRSTEQMWHDERWCERWNLPCKYLSIDRGAGTGSRSGERPPGKTLGAAVHRHSLDRLNAINDSLKKKA